MPFSSAANNAECSRPFQCLVCHSRFTRHENLKRHAALHCRSPDGIVATIGPSLSCTLCPATFSRPDLRSRHMRRKHLGRDVNLIPERRCANSSRNGTEALEPSTTGYDASASSPTSSSLLGGDTGQLHSDGDGATDVDTLSRPRGRPRFHDREDQCIRIVQLENHGDKSAARLAQFAPVREPGFPRRLLQFPSGDVTSSIAGLDPPPTTHNIEGCAIPKSDSWNPVTVDVRSARDQWTVSDSQIRRGSELFFTHVSSFVPFLHLPTFDAASVAQHLLYSMVCLAYQYGEDPDTGDREGTGAALSERCFRYACTMISLEEDAADDDSSTQDKVSMIQSYLLIQIYAMMYQCGTDTSYGLMIHSKMIFLARTKGLMQQYSTDTNSTRDLDSLWCQFIQAESQKRTLFAAHQIDALWYQLLSIPRQLSHLEIKHELPCPEEFWTAKSSVEWAHRKLASLQPGPLPPYSDAVKSFLSPSIELRSLPTFDLYGAVNITHFLSSSAREISGFCAMTGIFSTERLEPLQSSLIALGSFIRSQIENSGSSHGALCEAVWESAMIESHMWSASHIEGVVGGGMDALLQRLTDLAPSCDFVCDTHTVAAMQPHLDWFLRYLDITLVPDTEAPWVIVYAYKAFIIAWQFALRGQSGSMQSAGIHDGDTKGALAWAKVVFGRRQRWRLGKIVLSILDTLDCCHAV
ncbi:Transcription factor [Moelleriella libera RCEF 2490]|uniref:Transcription factor n=1 Tax=Moelleriella libera RCEF 2490 TaxID=1081109 RepID=A0A167ZF53_9HYPO|nr:Transcription factor [Moelleriella libera RCEF 2490]